VHDIVFVADQVKVAELPDVIEEVFVVNVTEGADGVGVVVPPLVPSVVSLSLVQSGSAGTPALPEVVLHEIVTRPGAPEPPDGEKLVSPKPPAPTVIVTVEPGVRVAGVKDFVA
jgi:hypothetical protein